MNLINFLIITLVTSVLESQAEYTGGNDRCANVKAPFEGLRKKRHLTFPPGTAIVMTLSLVKAVLVHAPSGWNIAVEIDVIYPLPSPEMTNAYFKKKFHHRQKRELWETIEAALGSYNMNGRSCIYRSICEAKLHLAPAGRSLVHDILRSIFSAPVHEEEFKSEVNETYEELLEHNICEKIHDCPISLIEIILALNKSR
ncbi:unnamed protein product [Arctia plantaginis]|uniref:Uncharacterized protein n=1 Tax=Arctia plantaginis TaxID=874455 RepID=A0A8S1BNW3_ARCPL|nr:unnamed protein product [Arctia plantaginis]CAB3260553.1 unnamed protein product [Arctia plantaginis]